MKREHGLSMIELLVGLAIGSMVIVGAVFVYNQSRVSYGINETQARLQENARYAFAILENDIQLAGNYGFTNFAPDLNWGSVNAVDLLPNKTAYGPTDCGTNFALYVMMPIEGWNDAYPTGGCQPTAATVGSAVAGADVLAIRRVSTEATTASVAKIQVYADRSVGVPTKIFNSATAPGASDAKHEIRDLMYRRYYVGANSSAVAGFPTLWRKSLVANSGGTAPEVVDEEILPGVEDFQIQFGIDTGDRNADGIPDVDTDPEDGQPDTTNGIVSRWVQPDNTLILPKAVNAAGIGAQVVAVRVWLRLRADAPEVGYLDVAPYQYAGMAAAWYAPAGALQQTRRLLVSRTFYVRNARVF
ncbi:MAG TPA: PilW family protein [Steroidobacteraceae bacterium]|nr:PilW family protein [Steroidobacteraceae bacterium]